MGLKFKTTKSLFGFTFLLNRASKFENQIVSGVVLIDVVDGHPAKRDGLKARDIILALNGKPFPRNLPEDIFLKIGILSHKLYTKNFPNTEVCDFIFAYFFAEVHPRLLIEHLH